MSKDRREFNRNRPVSQRQGRYGGAAAAPRKPSPKPVAAAASEDEEGAEDQAPRTTFNDDGEEVDADEYEQNELERDERGRYLRKSERDELDHKRKMSGKDFDIETMEDDKDYKDSDPDLERYDIAGRYEEGAKSGGYLEKTAKETDLEFMMHNAFWESYKTDSGYFMDAYKLDNHERTVIPKPRSLRKLLFRQMSNISQAVPVGSVGYANAEVAWSVVHKNIYYSDTQKQSVVDLIGTKTNEVYEYINQGPMSNTWENPSQAYDPVFRYGFRKGIEVIEEEEQEAAIRETHKQSTKRFVQAETDWEQEAVDDEDALI